MPVRSQGPPTCISNPDEATQQQIRHLRADGHSIRKHLKTGESYSLSANDKNFPV